MENPFKNAKSIQEKREILKNLSNPLKGEAKEGAESLNQLLKKIYAQSGHIELKTIQQWNKEGKRVNKGETALCLWGKPKNRETLNSDNDTTGKFFPVCFVFSNLQVN